jgi:predicted nucleic-acid-binding protein
MYRYKTSDQFARFFKHAIRNGKNEQEAIDEAWIKTRQIMAEYWHADTSFTNAAERSAAWADVVDTMIVARGLVAEITKELPIDKSKLAEQTTERNAAELKNVAAR